MEKGIRQARSLGFLVDASPIQAHRDAPEDHREWGTNPCVVATLNRKTHFALRDRTHVFSDTFRTLLDAGRPACSRHTRIALGDAIRMT